MSIQLLPSQHSQRKWQFEHHSGFMDYSDQYYKLGLNHYSLPINTHAISSVHCSKSKRGQLATKAT